MGPRVDADDTSGPGAKAGFLPELADNSFFHSLPEFDETSGESPLPSKRRSTTSDQQDSLLVEPDRVDRECRPAVDSAETHGASRMEIGRRSRSAIGMDGLPMCLRSINC